MGYDRGPPSWVSKQNETALRIDSDRMSSKMSMIESENNELKKELEKTRRRLKECEERLKMLDCK